MGQQVITLLSPASVVNLWGNQRVLDLGAVLIVLLLAQLPQRRQSFVGNRRPGDVEYLYAAGHCPRQMLQPGIGDAGVSAQEKLIQFVHVGDVSQSLIGDLGGGEIQVGHVLECLQLRQIILRQLEPTQVDVGRGRIAQLGGRISSWLNGASAFDRQIWSHPHRLIHRKGCREWEMMKYTRPMGTAFGDLHAKGGNRFLS